MRFARVTGRAVFLGALLAAAVTVIGAEAASAGQPIVPVQPIAPVQPKFPLCVYPSGAGPGYNASIGNQDNGKTVCIRIGEKLLVSLSAPTATGVQWAHVQVSPAGVLTAAPLTLMLSRGMTAANFLAVRNGVVKLSSQRHVCPPAANGGASCDAMLGWRATVIVRSGGKPIPEVRL
jgi:hypothetical protein